MRELVIKDFVNQNMLPQHCFVLGGMKHTRLDLINAVHACTYAYMFAHMYSFIYACLQMPVDQPSSLLEVSDSAHTVGFVNRKHILAATTVIPCGEIWDLKSQQTLGIIYLHLPLSQKILHDSQSGWAVRWRTRWTWAPATGHGSLDRAGPCSPPRWHPVWMVVWLLLSALKQTITPLKVLKIKATDKSSFVCTLHMFIQTSSLLGITVQSRKSH